MHSIYRNGLTVLMGLALWAANLAEAFSVLSTVLRPLACSTPSSVDRQSPSSVLPFMTCSWQLYQRPRVDSSLYASESSEDASTTPSEVKEENMAADGTEEPKLSWRQRVGKRFSKNDGEEKVPFRQRLAKMGLACVLSYGFVSNMNYSISISLAWFIFSKKTGLSPLAPGQWKNFLAVYAGFWVMNNFLRPLRVTAAVAISTQVDKVVKAVQDKLKVKRAAAVGICVFLANVVGTLSVTALGIILAATLSQTPIFPPKV